MRVTATSYISWNELLKYELKTLQEVNVPTWPWPLFFFYYNVQKRDLSNLTTLDKNCNVFAQAIYLRRYYIICQINIQSSSSNTHFTQSNRNIQFCMYTVTTSPCSRLAFPHFLCHWNKTILCKSWQLRSKQQKSDHKNCSHFNLSHLETTYMYCRSKLYLTI